MKRKFSVAISLIVLMAIMLTSAASAQYSGFSWSTSYSVVNMGEAPTDIQIHYYDQNGAEVAAAFREYQDVPAGASRTVVQFDETALGAGRYSAVISAGEPVAATVNQQLVESGATNFSSKPPFSSYSGQSAGDTTITLPQVMHNWFDYYTEIFIMNVSGDTTPANVSIAYTPSVIGTTTTGATGVSDTGITINQYASFEKSQQNMTNLAAPASAGTLFAGRFFGSATITSDKPIVAVVNQHNIAAKKLMTYNGFADEATGTEVFVPQHMKNWFGGYFGSLLIANPNDADANVTITYTPDVNFADVLPNDAELSVDHTIPGNTSLNRYDGPGASAAQSDLAAYSIFFGSVTVTSDVPVVVQENIEAVASGAAQGGAYNGMTAAQATTTVVVPLIQADFYGLYTSLTVQNTTDTAGTCTVTYTSDDQYSSKPNQSKGYDHALPAGGSFNVYEGHGAGGTTFIGDINQDAFWRTGTGLDQRRFIGSATIECTVEAVAFVNSELDINQADSMYTFNAFNK